MQSCYQGINLLIIKFSKMKKTILISMLVLSFCLCSQVVFGQDNTDSKEDPIKEQFVKAYSWTKPYFEDASKSIVSIKQMQTVEGHEYILVESEATKTLYDTSGKQYCADHAELNCVEFYKLNEGKLTWKKS